MIDRLCIIGVGLIGGSLARALRKHAMVRQVVGCGRSETNLERATQLGVIDTWSTQPAEAVSGADVIVVAVPLGATRHIFDEIRDSLEPDAVLTDVGSAKRCVIEDARAAFGKVPQNFVAGHPIAGTQHSGVEASFASLFENHKVILTPEEGTAAGALELVKSMWQTTGASVVIMDADHHDEVLAATSHLPHLLAYSLVDTLGQMQEHREMFNYAAGGFRDFTRIASSDPTMWHDICLANRGAMLQALNLFQNNLSALAQAIDKGDSEELRAVFSRAKRLRDAHSA